MFHIQIHIQNLHQEAADDVMFLLQASCDSHEVHRQRHIYYIIRHLYITVISFFDRRLDQRLMYYKLCRDECSKRSIDPFHYNP